MIAAIAAEAAGTTAIAIAASALAIDAILRGNGWKTSSRLWLGVARDTYIQLRAAEAERDELRRANEALLFTKHRRDRADDRTQETTTPV